MLLPGLGSLPPFGSASECSRLSLPGGLGALQFGPSFASAWLRSPVGAAAPERQSWARSAIYAHLPATGASGSGSPRLRLIRGVRHGGDAAGSRGQHLHAVCARTRAGLRAPPRAEVLSGPRSSLGGSEPARPSPEGRCWSRGRLSCALACLRIVVLDDTTP